MDTPILLVVPAALALLCKAGIFVYAQNAKVRNLETKYYLAFLIALSIQNVVELQHFLSHYPGKVSYISMYIFYAAGIAAIAFLFHLSICVAKGTAKNYHRIAYFVYVYAVVLVVLLFFTSWLIEDFVPLNYSVRRVSGPLYFLFEVFAISVFCSVIGILFYAARNHISPSNRAKASTLLLAIVPMSVVVVGVLLLLHFEIYWVNAALINPIATTYFLLVTAYAIHQHRLFDIQFFIPWSKVRKRKTAFYNRIRSLVGEMAQLGSVDSALDRLADVLKCPIALVGAGNPVLATVGGSQYMAKFPKSELKKYDHILVANEIADVYPETYKLMQHHHVAAMVPFHPHSRSASGWLLLGDKFSDQVYSPLDFRFVEQLFDKMSDLFLDRLLDMHSQLDSAQRNIEELTLQHTALNSRIHKLELDNSKLKAANLQLLKEQPADSLSMQRRYARDELDDMVTFLGPDRKLKTALSDAFPHLKHYTQYSHRNLQRIHSTDLIIVAPPPLNRVKQGGLLLDVLTENTSQLAALLYGSNSRSFGSAHRDKLVGHLVEVVPEGATVESIKRKARALSSLHKSLFSLEIPDAPLLGISPAFLSFIGELERSAGFSQPVWFKTEDPEQAISASAALHRLSGQKGSYVIVDDEHLLSDLSLFQNSNNTVIICNPAVVPTMTEEFLSKALASSTAARIVIVSPKQLRAEVGEPIGLEGVMAHNGKIDITIPSLLDRRQDLPLLVHYFTLQFNLRAGTDSYLSHDQAEQLSNKPENCRSIENLRNVIWRALGDRSDLVENKLPAHSANGSRHLSELVSSFEAEIIEDAVRRCDGNKSRAARLLGLRPNTLHYKMERYGLGTDGEEFN